MPLARLAARMQLNSDVLDASSPSAPLHRTGPGGAPLGGPRRAPAGPSQSRLGSATASSAALHQLTPRRLSLAPAPHLALSPPASLLLQLPSSTRPRALALERQSPPPPAAPPVPARSRVTQRRTRAPQGQSLSSLQTPTAPSSRLAPPPPSPPSPTELPSMGVMDTPGPSKAAGGASSSGTNGSTGGAGASGAELSTAALRLSCAGASCRAPSSSSGPPADPS